MFVGIVARLSQFSNAKIGSTHSAIGKGISIEKNFKKLWWKLYDAAPPKQSGFYPTMNHIELKTIYSRFCLFSKWTLRYSY